MLRASGILLAVLVAAAPGARGDEPPKGGSPGAAPAAEPPPRPTLRLTGPLLRAFRDVIERFPEAIDAEKPVPEWFTSAPSSGPTVPAPVAPPVETVVLDAPTFLEVRSELAWAQHAAAALAAARRERDRLEGMRGMAERARDEMVRAGFQKDVATGLARVESQEKAWTPKDDAERANVEHAAAVALPLLPVKHFPVRRRPPSPRTADASGGPMGGLMRVEPAAPPVAVAEKPEEKKPLRKSTLRLTEELLTSYVALSAEARAAGKDAPDGTQLAARGLDPERWATLQAEVRWHVDAIRWLADWTLRRKGLVTTQDEMVDMISGGAVDMIDPYRAISGDIDRGDEHEALLRPAGDLERDNRHLAKTWLDRLDPRAEPSPK
jgi:hypothetical protein